MFFEASRPDSLCSGCFIDYSIGMHFPASDIPKQAQELYKINRIRLLHDRGAETAQLVCTFVIVSLPFRGAVISYPIFVIIY